jgi:hypothetical protein
VQQPPPGATALTLRRAGLALRRYRRQIAIVQWLMVIIYLVLVTTPVLLPLPQAGARMLDSFTLSVQFLLWGLWWPLVLLSVMLLGRAWCGLLCPEGTLTEWVSRRGLGRAIPPWLRWGGWPLCTFLIVTLYGQVSAIYTQPWSALMLLGGSTTAAIAIGLLYGRGKRVWCRYLCPVTGVFGLLAKIAPVHFQVDRDAWDNAPRGRRAGGKNLVDCAPLIDIRRMQSTSDCNMCGRCAGEREAVQLALRSPNTEILSIAGSPATQPGERWSARLLVFGMLGMAMGTFHWQASPWQDALQRDVTLLVAYLISVTLLVGGWLWLWLQSGARASGSPWFRLAQVLIPFAGASLVVGLSLLTTDQLARNGIPSPWADVLRGWLIGLGALWSLWLAHRMGKPLPVLRGFLLRASIVAAIALPLAAWWLQLRWW